MGAGGDGTAQFVCKSMRGQVAVAELVQQRGMSALPLTIHPATTVRAAVIPVAGFAASVFPATKVVSPPLFPICDGDGVVKPAILIIVEQLCAAGLYSRRHRLLPAPHLPPTALPPPWPLCWLPMRSVAASATRG